MGLFETFFEKKAHYLKKTHDILRFTIADRTIVCYNAIKEGK